MNFNRAFAIRHLPSDTIEIYLSHLLPGKSTVDHVTSVVVQESDIAVDLGYDPSPIRLEREASQQLMDDLWLSGVRPTHAKAGDDLIEALRDHVTDSRELRDKLLEHFLLPPLHRPRIKRDRS